MLNRKEKFFFFLLGLIFLVSAISLGVNFYFSNTKIAPKHGGIYTEGVIGQPRFINPLYLSTQDVDRDLVEILFSGLMKYNEKGELINDLAERIEEKEEGKIFEVYLKKDVLWHDGEKLEADDVIFTINLLQDPQYDSPLGIKWGGITVEKISENGVRFRLPKKYSGFLENLTVKILPEHIFEDISPENLPWSLISQEYLIGSGPFKFKEVTQEKSGHVKKLTFERNNNYYSKKPFLQELSFSFYQSPEELLRAAQMREIDGFSLTDPKYFKNIPKNFFKAYAISIPRYFAVFFNFASENIFSEKELREALALSLNKKEILQNVFLDKGKEINSPILPDFFGFEPSSKTYDFDKVKAEEILDAEGFVLNPETKQREKTIDKQALFTFKRNLVQGSQGEDVTKLQECLAQDPEVYPDGEVTGYFGPKTKAAVIRFQEKYAEDILKPIGLTKGTGDVKPMTREKLNEICFEKPKEIVPLEITLVTCDKFPLIEIAEAIKKNWEEIGIRVSIEKVSLSDLQTDVLANRSFEALLFGEALGSIPDPFPFWHSSQKDYPGLNISSYESKQADQALDKARSTSDAQEKQGSLEEFQEIIIEDLPAIFLVRPDFVYMLGAEIKGYNIEKITEPAKRFSTIENWYVKTQRVWR